MALKRRKPRRRASITSLIDVIFLLLLFFMLSSTFSRFSEIEISISEGNPGGAGRAEEGTRLVIESVGVRLGSEQLADDVLVARLESLKATGASQLSIVPAESVLTQRLIDVLTLAASVKGLEITLSEPVP
ncbi:MAG: biopolymer transporter ExbD [Pseudomonadota bacterium]